MSKFFKIFLSILCLVSNLSFAQKKSKNTFFIGFYNLENLFDTEDDPTIDDSEFLPSAANQWDEAKYQKKLQNMAKAINSMGNTNAPDILGLCEVENKRVLEDLIKQNDLKDKNYGIVHYNSPDERGIDVAMLYKKRYFTPFKESSLRINFPENKDKTRDVLLVSGILGKKDTLHIFVAHFPSRRGGQKESEPKRMFVASQVRERIDSLQKRNPKANVIVMGDLNDEPFNKSIVEVLKAKPYSNNLKPDELFNAMGVMKAEGKGTHAYYNSKEKATEWSLLDQIILSPALVDKKNKMQYVLRSATIHKPEFLLQNEPEQFRGQPLRTFAGKKYLAGYSDHLPVYIQVVVKK
jgi:predicted extracellular nuclease